MCKLSRLNERISIRAGNPGECKSPNIVHFLSLLLNARHDLRESSSMTIVVVLEQIYDFLMLEVNQAFLHQFKVE